MVQVIEYQAKISNQNSIEIPERFRRFVTNTKKPIRIMLLIDDAIDEDTLWTKTTSEQFLQGYSESDSIYDKL